MTERRGRRTVTEETPDRSLRGEPEATGDEAAAEPSRLPVLKTYKLYVNGQFPRTESGRYDKLLDAQGRNLANVCRSSRKDFRDAVVAARAAQSGWAARSAYNRSQVLYRAGEMLEGRREQFVAELETQGMAREAAEAETLAAIDRWIYFAGWADKVQQVWSSVNPVASSHFNFSLIEPTGVVSVLAPEESGLLGLVSTLAPIVVSGNTCVALASSRFPLTAITLGEVLHASDFPPGVINLLTGRRSELVSHFASHLDVNAIVWCGEDAAESLRVQEESVRNIKRVVLRERIDWHGPHAESPYPILDTVEVKTTWHPVGS
ncbi:MAG TPA: aldehyde dehydrogenase family protein [Thermoanaerobaculia bacterium]|nr:aldehyde dehydrogenase family protein [Thermoanaerobaculia bacterium]